MKTLICLCLGAVIANAAAEPLPSFGTDTEADAWLRVHSERYLSMAKGVDDRTGYTIRDEPSLPSGGNVVWENGKAVIELSHHLAGAERVSILIFELTNCFQAGRHQEVDAGAASGEIKSAAEFGLLHELVEYDGLRHHRAVLAELEANFGHVPPEMLRWINPNLKSLAEYELPFAYDFVKSEKASGHTKHYWKWFPVQTGTAKAPADDHP